MKKSSLKKVLTVMLAAAMAVTIAVVPVSAKAGYQTTVTRISHPGNQEGETDGLVDPGDRETSYAWCMAARGDYVYIGTNKNIVGTVVEGFVSALEAKGVPADTSWAISDAVTNGDFPRPTTDEGGYILRCNCKTNEIEKIYTAPEGTSFRMAITHGNNVYFGSYASGGESFTHDTLQGQSNDIFCIDENDNVTKVFSSFNGTSMRAACEYDGKLYFGGVDASEDLDEGYEDCAKLAILVMDENDNSKWDRVADYKDFGKRYAADMAMSNAAASPIWDICEYNGEIYATLPNILGFAVFKGHPAKDGETANEYGWTWTEVVGFNNGINPIGLNPNANLKDAAAISLAATPVVFQNKLYLFDFDHTIGSVNQAVTGIIQQASGQDVKASTYLYKMYRTLHHTQSLWVLDDSTGKFEKVEGFTKLLENTTNEYVWRAEIYNDELYLTTMDSAIVYNYLTRLTNGSFINMTPEEWKSQIEYLKKLKDCLNPDDSGKIAKAKQKLEEAVQKLEELGEKLKESEKVTEFMEEYREALEKLSEAYEALKEEAAESEFADDIDDLMPEDMDGSGIAEKIKEFLNENDLSKLVAPDYDVPLSTLSEEEFDQVMEDFKQRVGNTIAKMKVEIPELQPVSNEQIEAVLAKYLDKLSEDIAKEIFNSMLDKVKDQIPEETLEQIKALAEIDPKQAAQMIKEKASELKEGLPEDAQAVIDQLADYDADAVKEQVEKVVDALIEKLPESIQEKVDSQLEDIEQEAKEKIKKLAEDFSEENRKSTIEAIEKAIKDAKQGFIEDYGTLAEKLLEKADSITDLTSDEFQQIVNDYIDAETEAIKAAIANAVEEMKENGEEISDEDLQKILDEMDEAASSVKSAFNETLDNMDPEGNTPIGELALNTVNGKIRELNEKLNVIYNTLQNAYDTFDWEGFKMYVYINDIVKNDIWGFDMLRTSDGENFEVVTNDGFGDRYNYGGRSLVSTPYGLYIGTANPFYGAQLYLLKEEEITPDDSEGVNTGDKDTTDTNTDNKDNGGQKTDDQKNDDRKTDDQKNDTNNGSSDENNDTSVPGTSDSTSAMAFFAAATAALGAGLVLGRKKKDQ